MLIDSNLQRNLRQACDDIEDEGIEGATALIKIGCECLLAMDDATLADAVNALRSDPAILRALRPRNAQLDGRIDDLNQTLKSTGLAALIKRDQ